jgi:hypothetical protein
MGPGYVAGQLVRQGEQVTEEQMSSMGRLFVGLLPWDNCSERVARSRVLVHCAQSTGKGRY